MDPNRAESARSPVLHLKHQDVLYCTWDSEAYTSGCMIRLPVESNRDAGASPTERFKNHPISLIPYYDIMIQARILVYHACLIYIGIYRYKSVHLES